MAAQITWLPDYAGCSAARTSRSCMARRMRRSSSRAAELGYRGLAITDECSLAGARACMSPRRRKGCRSSSARISPSRPMRSRRATIRGPAPSKLVLLAQNREGYGNLAELITWRRMAAPKAPTR
jgi:error-prone DNA polymerase